MTREVILPDADRSSYERYHFAPGVQAGNLVLLSGQLGLDSAGDIPQDLSEEFRNAWRAVGRILQHAGLGYEQVIEYTTYHVGLRSHLGDFIAVRDEFISPPWPAWTAIGIAELAVPRAHVEIRVTAHRE
jgi:enamine deaminase RidA (YjgF/YER057c/UK114 family)